MAGAGSAGGSHRRGPTDRERRTGGATRAAIEYLRANPQVFVLLLICIVLGLGTFLAVLFGLLTAGSGQTNGEPSGAILLGHEVLAAAHALS